MGLYIPDKKKPKSCEECRKTYLEIPNCPVVNKMISCWGTAPGCPLEETDLVRCGECKKREKRTTFNGLPFLYCLKMKVSVGSDQYCYWGERE